MNTLSVSEWTNNNKNQAGRIKIGIKITKRDVRNQLVIILQELQKYSHINAVVVVPLQKFENDKIWYSTELPDTTIVSYAEHEHALLANFDIVLLQETNPDTNNEFPNEVIKIGLPHGVDLKLGQTMYNFGGGYCFDYILGALKKPLLPEDYFFDSFTPELRNHARPYVCEIPFGFPKLDIFLNRVSAHGHENKSIAYHLSNLMMEAPSVPEQIPETLKNLLNNFPEYEIVFRPYHGDYRNPVIMKCLEMGAEYPNFRFSDADNYVDDYAASVAMVCHRPYRLHLFSLATGRNVFLSHPDDTEILSDDPMFISCPQSALIETMKAHLEDIQNIPHETRVSHCKTAGIYNPGFSIEYFVNSLPDILNDRKRSDWTYYSLAEESHVDLNIQIGLHLLATRPANMAFTHLLERYPDIPMYWLFAADSYARVTWGHGFYYQRSLNLFHALILNPDVSIEVRKEMAFWWKSCGSQLLDYLITDSEKNGYKLLCDITALQKYADTLYTNASTSHHQEPEKPFPLALIDLASLRQSHHKGPLALYYSGPLAMDFLNSDIAAHSTITAVFDPDQKKQGSKIGNLIVQSPPSMDALSEPILICSHSRRMETYLRLRRTVPSEKKIYALCQDQRALRLLHLIASRENMAQGQ